MGATVSGKQAAYIMILARKAGMNRQEFLEWLEYDSGWDLACEDAEDIPLASANSIIEKLKDLAGEE